ncbi:MAG: decarboxylating 6-phosphogluconate dehydrogenase [Candidatus Schekmanbacteria bacterium]|nr:MAG: decarboxylating 6-phosphogluconate dehydrogenase [Candidatus Schekmanbacteria bacterium]
MEGIGIIGLGKIGKIIAKRLCKAGINVAGYDIAPDKEELEKIEGLQLNSSINDLVDSLTPQRIIWIMVPAGEEVDKIIDEILQADLTAGDIIIDGGNSDFRDSIRRAKYLKDKNIFFLDVGTSGGVKAEENGFCLMIGGEKDAFNETTSIMEALACKDGYLYTGKSGSGHFVKMVHNAIEYGMMEAIGEGFELLHNGPYKGMLDLEKIAHLWSNGSIIRSFLIELTAQALSDYPELINIEDYVEDSGEARWALREAIDYNIPFDSISHSLFKRIASRQDESFALKMISALRKKFGGHKIKEKE